MRLKSWEKPFYSSSSFLRMHFLIFFFFFLKKISDCSDAGDPRSLASFSSCSSSPSEREHRLGSSSRNSVFSSFFLSFVFGVFLSWVNGATRLVCFLRFFCGVCTLRFDEDGLAPRALRWTEEILDFLHHDLVLKHGERHPFLSPPACLSMLVSISQ